jgi:hypothetical protein
MFCSKLSFILKFNYIYNRLRQNNSWRHSAIVLYSTWIDRALEHTTAINGKFLLARKIWQEMSKSDVWLYTVAVLMVQSIGQRACGQYKILTVYMMFWRIGYASVKSVTYTQAFSMLHLNVVYSNMQSEKISKLSWGSGGMNRSCKYILNASYRRLHDFGQDCGNKKLLRMLLQLLQPY